MYIKIGKNLFELEAGRGWLYIKLGGWERCYNGDGLPSGG